MSGSRRGRSSSSGGAGAASGDDDGRRHGCADAPHHMATQVWRRERSASDGHAGVRAELCERARSERIISEY